MMSPFFVDFIKFAIIMNDDVMNFGLLTNRFGVSVVFADLLLLGDLFQL